MCEVFGMEHCVRWYDKHPPHLTKCLRYTHSYPVCAPPPPPPSAPFHPNGTDCHSMRKNFLSRICSPFRRAHHFCHKSICFASKNGNAHKMGPDNIWMGKKKWSLTGYCSLLMAFWFSMVATFQQKKKTFQNKKRFDTSFDD